MTPSNPANGNANIMDVMASDDLKHQVAPVAHTHTESEVSGLVSDLEDKADKVHDHNRIFYNSGNQTAVVKVSKDSSNNVQIELSIQDSGEVEFERKAVLNWANMANAQRAFANPDSAPTASSTNLVTSGGVKDALDSKQNTLTFDSTPTANSTNPVTSGGVKAAIDAASADPMPIIRGLSGGDSVDLDEALTQPNTMARFIILNEYGNDYALPLWDIFYSNTLPVHKSGSENDELPNGEYLLATVFRINSSEHEHQNCYFVSFDSIFSE